MIKFSDTYTIVYVSEINICPQIEEDLFAIRQSDSTVNLNLTGRGYDLFLFKLFNDKKVIKLTAKSLNINEKGKILSSTINLLNYAKQIEESLDYNVKVSLVQPQNIVLFFKDVMRKKLPIVADVKLNFNKDFQLYDTIEVYPDSATIIGNKDDLDKIKDIITRQIVISKAEKDTAINTELILYRNVKLIDPKTNQVSVNIKIDRFVEKIVDVNISIADSVGSNIVEYKVFPNKAKIICSVPFREYNLITSDSISAQIKVHSGESVNNMCADILINKQPKRCKILKIIPEKVEFLKIYTNLDKK